MISKNIDKKSEKNKTGQVIRPRLAVFRSNREIYAQIIDSDGKILAAASSLKINEKKNRSKIAESVGKQLAQIAFKAGIEKIVFDRRRYKYHGRVAALAKGAREGGLKF